MAKNEHEVNIFESQMSRIKLAWVMPWRENEHVVNTNCTEISESLRVVFYFNHESHKLHELRYALWIFSHRLHRFAQIFYSLDSSNSWFIFWFTTKYPFKFRGLLNPWSGWIFSPKAMFLLGWIWRAACCPRSEVGSDSGSSLTGWSYRLCSVGFRRKPPYRPGVFIVFFAQ